MLRSQRKWRLLLGCGLLSVYSLAQAGSEAQDQVDYREGVFHIMAWDFSQMKRMLEDESRYDLEDFQRRANRLSDMATMLPEGFPETRPKRVKTDAKKDIWKNWQDFQQKLTDIESTSKLLSEAVATGDKSNITQAFGEVGNSCKGCHDKYRKD